MRTTYIIIITVFSIFFNLLILIFPELTIKSAAKGLQLWYNSALPSLLPFIISINILKHTPAPLYISKIFEPITKRLFNVSGIGVFPIVMGMLSGYPLGAKLCCELYSENKLSKEQAQHILCFSNNSGPLFITGTVGAIFLNNVSAGWFLMVIHYISAIIIGIITAKKTNNINSKNIIRKKQECLYIGRILSESLENSIEAIVMIGGYIILFSIITGYISPLIENKALKGVICGIFEITQGCSIISKTNNMFIIAGLISWGGLSIHAQSLSYITKTDLSPLKYIFCKLLQSVISVMLFFTLYPIYAQKLS